MKVKVLSQEGKVVKEIELPSVFSIRIREDICQKYFEATKRIQPYAPFFLAGNQYSASGKIRHSRRAWKTAYGLGISRVPRKIFWRRGTQFYWQAATVANVVGGRRAHPPKIEHFLKEKKINKKEKKIAFESALASTGSVKYVKKRYAKLKDLSLPLIIESNILKLNAKLFFEFLRKILNENFEIALQNKSVRAGKGKLRGRKYKKNAGLLLVVGIKESFKVKGIEVVKVNQLGIKELWPLGRLTVYTENAINEIVEGKKNES